MSRPPIIDMTIAGISIAPLCARTAGRAIPIKTRNPVMNRPKSASEFPELSIKSSGLAHREQIQLGRGATIYVATTANGRKLCQMAEERMTRRNPIARTNDRPIMVLIPAVMMAMADLGLGMVVFVAAVVQLGEARTRSFATRRSRRRAGRLSNEP